MQNIFITGGAGYVGAMLVPYLLKKNHNVTVLDLFIYGEEVLENHPNLKKIKGDIRDQKILSDHLTSQDIVIHLACISNDPSFELNPKLGREINLEAFEPLVRISKEKKVRKFFYASSSSVYGIKSEKNVHEEMTLEPLTDYSRFKAECEKILFRYSSKEFVTTVVRPATVCGYSKRQRLDVVVNILTNLAFHKREISVFGGDQLRPNIHIKDMIRVYDFLINADENLINNEIFNVGFENLTINQISEKVINVLGNDIVVKKTPTNDNRSYHVSSEKIKKKLNFTMKYTVDDAIYDLKDAFEKKKLPNSLNDVKYFNIKVMQKINLE